MEPKAIQKATIKGFFESGDEFIQLMIKHLQKPHPETTVYLRDYGTYEDGREFVTVTINYIEPAFDANTFGPDEVPVDYRAGFSTQVLIDLDGNRVDFLVGKYDHIESQWKFIDGLKREHINMRWSFLPLAIYDTNPELRKTVKL